MFIYLVVFALSSAFFAYSEQSCQAWKKKLCVCIAIMLPAVLAGCRGPSIGVDVQVYGIPHFRSARATDGFIQYFTTRKIAALSEPLYYLMVFTLSRIFSNYHWALFVYSLITISFTYAGMSRFKKQMNTPLWLGMLLYYFAMYNTTLNAMRQLMAVAIIFWATSFLTEDNYKKFFLFTILGIGFHTSAILALVLFLIYYISQQKRNRSLSQQFFHGGLLVSAICTVFLVGGIGIQWMVNHGIIRANYLNYLSGGLYAGSRVSIAGVAVYGGYLILYLLHYKYLDHRRLESLFFAIVSVVILFTRLGQNISVYLPRIGYYFIPLQIVSFSNITNCYSVKSKKVWILFIVFCFLASWYAIFVYKGNSNTVPYIFDISP